MPQKPRIILTQALPLDVHQSLADQFDLITVSARPVRADFLAAADGAVAIVPCPGDRFDAAVIASLPASVRGLASYSVGLDHIDLSAARDRGLIVTNTPDVLTDATADLAVHLILSATRGASEAEADLRGGRWAGWRPDHVMGIGLQGRTLGLLGYGRIGAAVAKRAVAFGLKVVHYDHRGRGPVDDYSVPIASLEQFWAVSDILSLHAPSTDATRHIINRQTIEMMKKGVVLINTARGDLVDDSAVIAAAQSGHISAIGLDVYAGEPQLDPRYCDLPNATLLPHIGSSTAEARQAMGAKVLANLVAITGGMTPPDRVV